MKLAWLCKSLMSSATIWCVLLCGNASAIGVWQTGKITQSPWQEKGYQHVKIDQVQYTIMPGTKCEYSFIANGATQKTPQDVGSLRIGDKIAVMVEGNRIYQIEKTR